MLLSCQWYFKIPKVQIFASLIPVGKISESIVPGYPIAKSSPKFLIKPLIHRIAAVLEEAVVVVGAAEVELSPFANRKFLTGMAGITVKPVTFPFFTVRVFSTNLDIPPERNK
jgi:hypothetical protein